jgi:hypothetical protein
VKKAYIVNVTDYAGVVKTLANVVFDDVRKAFDNIRAGLPENLRKDFGTRVARYLDGEQFQAISLVLGGVDGIRGEAGPGSYAYYYWSPVGAWAIDVRIGEIR